MDAPLPRVALPRGSILAADDEAAEQEDEDARVEQADEAAARPRPKKPRSNVESSLTKCVL